VDYIVALSEAGSMDLAELGGKALGLGRLLTAGFPVPRGFCVTASAYRAALGPCYGRIGAALAGADPLAPATLDEASERAALIVREAGMPARVEEELRLAYRALRDGADASVAVRSSATAEDLPDLSFAGQQDSYLGVSGENRLVEAVCSCWASLWTARAIGYRARAGFAGPSAALPEMAVVVQLMVDARSAGVLFTADPVGGSRTRSVIEAVRGLGEALVSGRATPERFAVREGKLIEAPPSGSGTLSEAEALELASLGRAVEAAFGRPQDIEWARDGAGFSLLQSRPITSLYPLPEDGRPCRLLFSFGSWQGFLEPFTPLGSDMMLRVVEGVGRLLGSSLKPEEQTIFREAGGRLWVELGGLLRYRAGRAFARLFLDSIDPAAAEILAALEAEGSLPPLVGRISPRAALALLGFVPRILRRVARNMLFPARGRARLRLRLERTLRGLEVALAGARGPARVAEAARRFSARAVSSIFPEILGAMVSSQVPFQILLRMTTGIPGAREEVLELTRSLPHNVTTEMDLELWAAARAIRADPAALAACRALGPAGLSRSLASGSLPPSAAAPMERFLERYGFRGPGEIDLGRPRWRDDPAPLVRALLAYLEIEEGAADPASLFASGAESARAAAWRIEASVREARGAFAARLARFLAGRVRELSGLRESPKFGIVKILGALRAAFSAAGAELAEAGAIGAPDDVFFLRLAEIEGKAEDAALRAAAARSFLEREARRRRLPRLLAGDGSAFFDPPAPASEEDGRNLHGCPVSPGSVVGRARIVLDPGSVTLEAGDILVCPGTDPAWTPLFMAAAGLVTIVGGEMTHGSVVARECGIPAVVGVAAATERIPEGARILVDGSRGLVTILDP
jgi:phosphohistidine swiveling domain-containing protein